MRKGKTPLWIYLTSFGFLLLYSFIDTSYLNWADANIEYTLYLDIVYTGQWTPQGGLLNAVPMTTLFPATIQRMVGIEPLVFFKVYIAFLLAFLPVIVYKLSLAFNLDKNTALIAVIFVLVQFHFARAPLFARMDIALIFWGIILLAIKSNIRYRYWVIGVSAALMVLSHYGVSFIAIAVLLASVLKIRTKPALTALVSVVLFAGIWYGIIATAPAQVLKSVIEQSIAAPIVVPAVLSDGSVVRFTDGAFWQSTGGDLWHMGLSVDWSSIKEIFSFITFWLAVCIGIFGLKLYKSGRTIAITGLAVLGVIYIFPYLEVAYGFIRFYFFAVIALSPFFAYGLKKIYEYKRIYAVIAAALILAGYAAADIAQMFMIFALVLIVASTISFKHFGKVVK